MALFYPYYGDSTQLLEFLTISQTLLDKFSLHLERPPQHSKINATNMFVNEAVRAMTVMKSEVALIKYMTDLQLFQFAGIPGRKTRTRLFALLLDLATPGYPLYPTREVKTVAQRTINCLFPIGSFWRSIIHFGFRFLRPLSFVNWIQIRLAQFYAYLLVFISTVLAVFGMNGVGGVPSDLRRKKSIPPSPSKQSPALSRMKTLGLVELPPPPTPPPSRRSSRAAVGSWVRLSFSRLSSFLRLRKSDTHPEATIT